MIIFSLAMIASYCCPRYNLICVRMYVIVAPHSDLCNGQRIFGPFCRVCTGFDGLSRRVVVARSGVRQREHHRIL